MKKESLVFIVMILICNLAISQELTKYNTDGLMMGNNYIGGINENITQFNTLVKSPQFVISNKTELIDALATAKRGDTLFLTEHTVIGLTGDEKIRIPHGINIVSNRGENGSKGALIYDNTHGASPLLRLNGNNITIQGLRIQGPDTGVYFKLGILSRLLIPKKKRESYEYKKDALPKSTGIAIEGKNVRIVNCEIYGWTNAAIQVSQSAVNALVEYNYIHHNQHFGLGYGVLVYKTNSIIRANIFDYNNHSVTGSGHIGTGFTVDHNLFYQHHVRAWAIDMHGGKDRGDGTNIAGDTFDIFENIFYLYYDRPAVFIRGEPVKNSSIRNNEVIYLLSDEYINSYLKQRKDVGYPVKIDRKKKTNDLHSAFKFSGNRVQLKDNQISKKTK